MIFAAKGSNGLPGVQALLTPTSIYYGLVRMVRRAGAFATAPPRLPRKHPDTGPHACVCAHAQTDTIDGHQTVKFVFVIHIGIQVGIMQRAKLSTHKGGVVDKFTVRSQALPGRPLLRSPRSAVLTLKRESGGVAGAGSAIPRADGHVGGVGAVRDGGDGQDPSGQRVSKLGSVEACCGGAHVRSRSPAGFAHAHIWYDFCGVLGAFYVCFICALCLCGWIQREDA